MRTVRVKVGLTASMLVGMVAALILLLFIVDYAVRLSVPVTLPTKFASTEMWNQGFATAQGTWVSEGGASGLYDPLNTAEVDCYAELRRCMHARSSVSGSPPYLGVILETMTIREWSKEVIVFGTDARCVDYTYTLSRATKELTGIRKVKANADPTVCGGMDKEITLRLADGFGVHMSQANAATPDFLLKFGSLAILVAGVWGIWRVWRKV